MDSDSPFRVLLYYRYVEIAEPEEYASAHRELCESLELNGRILIGKEGINGTVSGTVEQTNRYIEAMNSDPKTSEMDFKIDPCDGHVFPKLSIKIRDEIVTLGREDLNPNEITGNRLSPREFFEAMQEENAIVIDGRNNYESDIGRFKGAVCPDVENFRDFPDWLAEHTESLKGKKILTYCTGGIRCEKLSGLIRESGFDDVAQLDGGIINYSHDPETQGRDFEGLCYVFDERVAVEVNHTDTREIVSTCKHCGEKCARYRNCGWPKCNAQTFICEACEKSFGKFCSVECRENQAAASD
ncbi:MAG: rhodanese-related sulfurtransferase [Verrucomicrobiales bacterium]|nr:rhodanese-related sulfurtransferase [Verrucomicrobiales bacterium]